MGFILKAIGAGIAMAGIDKARDSFVAESKRKKYCMSFSRGYYERRVLCDCKSFWQKCAETYQYIR